MVLVVVAPAVARIGVGCGLVAGRVRAGQHQPVLQLAGRLEDVQRIVRQLLRAQRATPSITLIPFTDTSLHTLESPLPLVHFSICVTSLRAWKRENWEHPRYASAVWQTALAGETSLSLSWGNRLSEGHQSPCTGHPTVTAADHEHPKSADGVIAFHVPALLISCSGAVFAVQTHNHTTSIWTV